MPHVEIPQAEFKVVILGDSHIGKTSLVTRFAEGYYRENSRPPTIGAFFVTKRITTSPPNETSTKIQIWDTAGAENFKQMAHVFYKNAAAIIICYDVTSRSSFEGMRRWLDEVRQNTTANNKEGGEVVVAIAALKTDLLNTNNQAVAAVPEYEVEQLAETLGVLYLPTSAKTDYNVGYLFQCVADRVLMNRFNGSGAGGEPMALNNIGMVNDGKVSLNSHALDSGNMNHHDGMNLHHHSPTADVSTAGAAASNNERMETSPSRKREQSNSTTGMHHTKKNEHDMMSSSFSFDANDSSKNKRSPTPSTDCTSIIDDGTTNDHNHSLWEGGKKKKDAKNKNKGNNSNNKEDGSTSHNNTCDAESTACAEESYYTCQPVVGACGVGGDGSSSVCTIQ